MARKPMWCGQYFLDVTHPKFLEEMLPKMIAQPKEWGYQAVKWDCLPDTANLCDACHDTKYDSAATTRQAMIAAFRSGGDFHAETAAKVFHVQYGEAPMPKDEAPYIKTLNARYMGNFLGSMSVKEPLFPNYSD